MRGEVRDGFDHFIALRREESCISGDVLFGSRYNGAATGSLHCLPASLYEGEQHSKPHSLLTQFAGKRKTPAVTATSTVPGIE